MSRAVSCFSSASITMKLISLLRVLNSTSLNATLKHTNDPESFRYENTFVYCIWRRFFLETHVVQEQSTYLQSPYLLRLIRLPRSQDSEDWCATLSCIPSFLGTSHAVPEDYKLSSSFYLYSQYSQWTYSNS